MPVNSLLLCGLVVCFRHGQLQSERHCMLRSGSLPCRSWTIKAAACRCSRAGSRAVQMVPSPLGNGGRACQHANAPCRPCPRGHTGPGASHVPRPLLPPLPHLGSCMVDPGRLPEKGRQSSQAVLAECQYVSEGAILLRGPSGSSQILPARQVLAKPGQA